jgi:hypothetical protein
MMFFLGMMLFWLKEVTRVVKKVLPVGYGYMAG